MAASTRNRTSIADLAAQVDASPRRIRRVLRSLDLGVGKGSRYNLTAAQVRKVRDALTDAS